MNFSPSEYDLAIVGGGQSAKAILMSLAEKGIHRSHGALPRRIAIFEAGRTFGPGFAWSSEVMLPEHFASQPLGRSRSEYGAQQVGQFASIVALLATQGREVDLFSNAEIADIDRDGGGWRLVLCTSAYWAKAVVLATGHWPGRPKDLNNVPYMDPWPAHDLQLAVKAIYVPKLRVGITGTYLTGVDAAISIALACGTFTTAQGERLRYEADRNFQITLISRHANLPWVWPKQHASYRLRYVNESNLEVGIETRNGKLTLPMSYVASLLLQELGESPDPHPIDRLMQGYRKSRERNSWALLECACRAAHPTRWLSAFAAALPILSEYSRWFEAKDYVYFRQYLKTAFFNVAMPMSRKSAEYLRALRVAGKIDLLKVGESRWSLKAGRPTIGWKLTGLKSEEADYDILINGRSGGGDIRTHPKQLIQTLLEKGLVQPGIRMDGTCGEGGVEVEGMHVDCDTCELIPRGEWSDLPTAPMRLYAIGPNLGGLFVDAHSIGQTMRDANRVINHLLSKNSFWEN